MLYYMPLACVAVFLLCVWTIPGLFNTPTPNIPDNPVVISSGEPQGSGQDGIVTNPPSDSRFAPIEIWPLTLNEVSSQLSADRAFIGGHFWCELTDEQLSAVFTDLPLTLIATAHYRGDGSLYNVMAYEASAEGVISFYNEYYYATTIEVIGAGGESMEDVIYEYEPITTNIWGVPVIAGVLDFKKNDGIALYIAKFKVGDVSYNIQLHDDDVGENGKDRLSLIVNKIIHYQEINGVVDLSILSNPVIPELRDDELTLKDARSDTDFGMYLPKSVPSRFSFESARRFINQETNSLSVIWTVGMDSIRWSISKPTEYDREHIVSASEHEKYDLSLYPIPRADSVPGELREYIDNPVFPTEELTLDVIKARAYYVDNDRGDAPGWRMDFSVLFDDVIVSVNIKGASPEQAWEIFDRLMS